MQVINLIIVSWEFGVLKVVTLKKTVFYDMTPCSLLDI
jgi:hypothetical protein